MTESINFRTTTKGMHQWAIVKSMLCWLGWGQSIFDQWCQVVKPSCLPFFVWFRTAGVRLTGRQILDASVSGVDTCVGENSCGENEKPRNIKQPNQDSQYHASWV